MDQVLVLQLARYMILRTQGDVDGLGTTSFFTSVFKKVACVSLSSSTYLVCCLHSTSCEETDGIVLKCPECCEHNASTIMAVEQTDLGRELLLHLVTLTHENSIEIIRPYASANSVDDRY